MEEKGVEEIRRDVVFKRISFYSGLCTVKRYSTLPSPTPNTFYSRGQILSGLMKAKVNFEHGFVVNSGMGMPLFMKCLF
jgi:hypothetical protein